MTGTLAIALLAAGVAQVQLRGGEQPPAGAPVAVSAAGVAFGAPGAAPGTLVSTVIGWDRVKSVGGSLASPAAQWLPIGEEAWRARMRLERGDALAAEPVLEKLFQTLRGERGPTAAVVSEGLMRCRIRRAAHVAAVEPWLAYLEATADASPSPLHASWAAEAGLPSVIDPGGLAPALPPIWLAWPSVEAYARSAVWTGVAAKASGPPSRVAVLARLYHMAAQHEAGEPVQWTDVASGDPATKLIELIVQSRVGDAERRAEARRGLQERLRPTPATGHQPPAPWLQAWVHTALGRSLLREDAPEQKKLGVIELLQVPAAHSAAHPYLDGVALAEASVALRALGDAPGADVLARELIDRYPTHPAHDWAPFAAARPASPRPAPAGSGGPVAAAPR